MAKDRKSGKKDQGGKGGSTGKRDYGGGVLNEQHKNGSIRVTDTVPPPPPRKPSGGNNGDKR